MITRRLTIGLTDVQVEAIGAIQFQQGLGAGELVRAVLDEYLLRHERQIQEAKDEMANARAKRRDEWVAVQEWGN